MERLTDKNHRAINTCGEYSSCYSCHREICYISELEHKLAKLEDVLEKYDIESAEDLDKFIHHKDCQIEKWKQDYENCSKLEKSISKEHQYCLDNWRACEQELDKLKQTIPNCRECKHLNKKIELNIKNKLMLENNKLEQELAELKQKVIVPKFYVGQNIFFIDNEYQIIQGVVDIILTGQDVFGKWCKYSIDLGLEYEDDIRFVDKDEEEIFVTKEEAEKKLAEIKGE